MSMVCVEDFRARAKRKLPKFAFDYLDGGAGSEAGIARNEQAFADITFKPRALINVEKRDLSTTFLGRRWAAPFGIAPVGLGNLMCPNGDEAIMRAALAADIPYTLSTAGTTSLERIAELGKQNAWFQLYVSGVTDDVADLIDRADRAGYDVLLVTVDIPVPARRLRDLRNNFAMPFRITPRVAYELITHPAWSLRTLAAGRPRFATIERYASASAGRQSIADYMQSQIRGQFDWGELKKLRDRWKRRLVVKGLMTAEDAVQARDLGCDAVLISNHGGRQMDSGPSTVDLLPEVRAAVGPRYPLLVDSGVRSGEHILKALAAGADFVLIGRAIMYAVGALGTPGAAIAIDLLIDEASRCMGQIGYTDIAGIKQAKPIRFRDGSR
jgi:isopentenyl diphosphate isomerase/L-lactate dehydrogenase-like FMN-dependent dehydrogenase